MFKYMCLTFKYLENENVTNCLDTHGISKNVISNLKSYRKYWIERCNFLTIENVSFNLTNISQIMNHKINYSNGILLT